MANVVYTANATVTGGRGGHGRTNDGLLDVDLERPPEMGGQGGGTNPEQLFAIGYAACFQSALARVANRRDLVADDTTIESHVHLIPNSQGNYRLAVELDVTLPSIDDAAIAAELIHGAHELCPYSNATRGNVNVRVTANGVEVD
jgi:Ohr subfamily peroxiredoxin